MEKNKKMRGEIKHGEKVFNPNSNKDT